MLAPGRCGRGSSGRSAEGNMSGTRSSIALTSRSMGVYLGKVPDPARCLDLAQRPTRTGLGCDLGDGHLGYRLPAGRRPRTAVGPPGPTLRARRRSASTTVRLAGLDHTASAIRRSLCARASADRGEEDVRPRPPRPRRVVGNPPVSSLVRRGRGCLGWIGHSLG